MKQVFVINGGLHWVGAKHSEEIITNEELKVENFFLSMRINEGTNLNNYISAPNMSEAIAFIEELKSGGYLIDATVEHLTLSPKGFCVRRLDNFTFIKPFFRIFYTDNQ